MAAVIDQKRDEKQILSTQYGSEVDEQIAQATSRIRVHDLTFGLLSLAAMIACYACSMILLDKYLQLSEWVRQVSFFLFLGTLAAATYWLLVRPLVFKINPLYAAVRVEKTIDDAKNSVTGYVDAQEKGGLHVAVKAAMSAKAAKAVGEADLNQAVDHRSLVVAGGVFVFFMLALIVMFLIFRPTQFNSLLMRSLVPYSSTGIASRTQIELRKPDPAELTITAGQTITIDVHIGGKVPAKDSPNRVRVLIRHNQAETDYEMIPMKEGETTRDWLVKVPEDMVLNGFWYKVAAGDAETPEYRINVHSLPVFNAFKAFYEYPAYSGKVNDEADRADIRALRGTKVRLLAQANRDVNDGKMKFELGGLSAIEGRPVPNLPKCLEFQFTVTEQTKYKLFMTTTAGERNTESTNYSISVDSDLPPTVLIAKPEAPEITVPANGQIAVDGTVGDDYGIEKVRLRLRVDGKELARIPYLNGQSFRRAKDNTWPRNLDYKLSVDLTKLKFADGTAFVPQENMILDYWVEAIDNCSEVKPVADWDNLRGNVGRSEVKKVRLLAPVKNEEKKQLDQNKDERKNEEQQHNDQQQQKLANEKRDNQQQKGENKQGENQPNSNNQSPNAGKPEQQDQNDKDKNGKGMGNQGDMSEPMNKKPDPTQPDNTPPKNTEPKNQQPQSSDPKDTQPGGMGQAGKNDGDNKSKPPEPKTGDMPPQGADKNPQNPMDSQPKPGDMQPNAGDKSKPEKGGSNEKGGMNDANPMQPPPMNQQNQDEKKAEDEANRVQNELNKNKNQEGEGKSNPSAKPEERTEPSQQKPQPKNGPNQDSAPKDQAKANDPTNPMNDPKSPMSGDQNAPAHSKSEGAIEKPPEPSQTKPAPSPSDPKNPKQKNTQPAESRNEEPLGGSPGSDKPEPKNEGPKPKDPGKNQDPASGSSAKPASDQKEGDSGSDEQNKKQDEAAKAAAKAKPRTEPSRGKEKDQEQAKGSNESAKSDPAAGEAKPEKSQESATAKPEKKDPASNNTGSKSEDKPGPGDMNMDRAKQGPGETKPEKAESPMQQGDNKPSEQQVDKGMDKSAAQEPKAGSDGAKGNTQKQEPKKGGADDKKIDPKQMEELKNAAKDLKNPDPKKQEEARKKLDQAVGEENRKAAEKKIDQLEKDLQSPDKEKREAAQKEVDEILKHGAEQAKKEKEESGKELSPEQLKDLANKAKDLNSKDGDKRKEAEKSIDETIGQEAREKLQQEQKDKKPGEPQDDAALQKEIQDLAKKKPGKNNDPTFKPQAPTNPTASAEEKINPMEADPKNRLKTAELQLEEFKKNRYNKELQDQLGWTQEKYEEFLAAQQRRVEQLEKEAAMADSSAQKPVVPPTGTPSINLTNGGKVDSRENNVKSTATGTGAVLAPPGFDAAKRKFAEALQQQQSVPPKK